MDYKAKLEAYINLCTPSFLIKMKTANDKSYFFKAYKSDYHKDSTVLKFTIADVDPVDEDYERWREINLLTEFGDNFNSLKEVIIPEHKDMYKDIETKGMRVACSVQDKCSGDKLNPPPPPAPEVSVDRTIATKSVKQPGKDARDKAREALPKLMPPPSITPAQVTNQSSGEFEDLSSDEEFVDPTSMYGKEGGRKKKKKRRKKRSRSKKRRNKRKNRTKKN
jgi:hypothetical protein